METTSGYRAGAPTEHGAINTFCVKATSSESEKSINLTNPNSDKKVTLLHFVKSVEIVACIANFLLRFGQKAGPCL
jgi:hypothetical protein